MMGKRINSTKIQKPKKREFYFEMESNAACLAHKKDEHGHDPSYTLPQPLIGFCNEAN